MSDQQVSAGGILAREWRVLKPMSWLLAGAVAVLVGGTWLYPMLRAEKLPAPLVIHREEKLEEDEIHFQDMKDLEGSAFLFQSKGSSGSFKPLVVYFVKPEKEKTFSHPFTLNFQGDVLKDAWVYPGNPAVAAYADGKWNVVTKPAEKAAGRVHYYSAEVEGAGTYALGYIP